MTPSEFKTLMPAFVGVADQDIQRWITSADPYFDVAGWGALYSDGLRFYVAWGLVDEGVAGVPAVANIDSLTTREKVGGIEVGYSDRAVEMLADDPFASNKFGRRYSKLAREVGMGAVAV
jgi:hypothetical protein